MLDINQIQKTFNAGTVNEKKALNGLDLHLQEGDFVTVIGGNGAGKSREIQVRRQKTSIQQDLHDLH